MYTGLDSTVHTVQLLSYFPLYRQKIYSIFGRAFALSTSCLLVLAESDTIHIHTSICAYSRSPLSLILLAGAVAGSTKNGKREDSPGIVTDSHWLCSGMTVSKH
jgi:hypothetical protein